MFAFCASARLRADGPWAQPPVSLVALFAAIMLCSATIYLYLTHADWAWLYLIDPRRVPRLFAIPAAAAGAGALFAGYYGMGRLLHARVAQRVVLAILGGGALVCALLAILARGRLLTYGSLDAFRAGTGVSLFAVRLGYVLVALLAGLGAAAAYVAVELLRDGRRATARLP